MTSASFKYRQKPVFAVLVASLLVACGSDVDVPSVKESSLYDLFVFNEIVASDDAVKQMVLSWDAASDVTGVTYTICRSSDAESTACDEELTSVTDELTASISVDSLVDTLTNAYYTIQASHDGFELNSNTLEISSDTVTEMIGYFKASNTGSGDQFGRSVALSGDGNTLVVGAPYEDNSVQGVYSTDDTVTDDDESSGSGAAYVYTLDDGVWQQSAYLKASNAGEDDSFGSSLALSYDGATIAVTASTEGADSSGAIYIFSFAGGSWSQDTYLTATINQDDGFGGALSFSDDGQTLVAGSPWIDNTGLDSNIEDIGAVFVFRNEDGVWVESSELSASNLDGDDRFGTSVSLSSDGTVLAVGAIYEDNSATGVFTDSSEIEEDEDGISVEKSGAVYVFEYINSEWSQIAYIKALNAGESDYFGRSVSLSGDGLTLAVGANYEDNDATGVIDLSAGETIDEIGSSENSGAVYLYSYTDAGWSEAAYIKASNVSSADYFGYRVQLNSDGDQLLVSAFYEDSSYSGVALGGDFSGDDTASVSGAAYLFNSVDGVWQQSAYLKASNTESEDYFGRSIASNADGSVIAIGANGEDNSISGILTDGSEIEGDYGTVTDSGAVYLY